MSHSSSPNSKPSIFGWVKNLKRGNLLSSDSVNDITSDNENLQSVDSRSPTKAKNIALSLSQSQSSSILPTSQASPPNAGHQDFLRPLLHQKSRSTNNVNRVRSNSLNQSEKSSSLRQHRDSFLQHNPLVDENSKYFGVPLEVAIREASAKISILNPDPSDHGLQYGEIPIVVAKCGVFLKNNGLTVEGIFRVGGSSKRLKELQHIFNTPPIYGKKLKWDGYTVHDAASILRRYLNALPEPLIPLGLYESFRDPLRKRTRIINYMKYKAENPSKTSKSALSSSTALPVETESTSSQLTEANIDRLNETGSTVTAAAAASHPTITVVSESQQQNPGEEQSTGEINAAIMEGSSSQLTEEEQRKSLKKSKNYKKLTRDVHEAIEEYKQLLDELPTASRQLLFYILDLLAMVQNHSGENLMSSRNLAAIFQPSILSHPNHDLDPEEYALSQSVVEFLVQYAYKLLPQQSPPSGKIVPAGEAAEQATEDPNAHIDANSNGNTGVVAPAPLKSEDSHSSVTSTSTTPIEETGLLSKPTSAKFKRQHSKSLPSADDVDNDLVGYHNSVKSKNSIPVIDSDNDFEITDDEIEGDNSEEDLHLRLNNGSVQSQDQVQHHNTLPIETSSSSVAIIVSTPSSKVVPVLVKDSSTQ
ncbi:GTPase activating protein (GAP) for RHO [Scheffersomyces stipitis CBS 6054]|uniref:GTPase activating protein (GAP) for RHO n=1 Tax=Scheffersomyces stipitis (strain ATCC 58785 / CBS 6054 / NBRC 10063 / NRRL Y-11545) TaxID=322104 RepID=A3M0P0_PICST|nr:GTPase activating protein (GAP) for RHO [Scheffersomyces stipitis CBS 6054]ABN68564.2 GTPase activating protein (GAP) for RHO [Scheffersomyces stipitis CBS 6054]